MEIILRILDQSYVLNKLLRFDLGNSFSVFSFWLDIRAVWLFSSSTCVFSSFLFFNEFFSRYQFVEFANCTICFFFHNQQNYRLDLKINIIYIYIYIYMCVWVCVYIIYIYKGFFFSLKIKVKMILSFLFQEIKEKNKNLFPIIKKQQINLHMQCNAQVVQLVSDCFFKIYKRNISIWKIVLLTLDCHFSMYCIPPPL